MSLTDAQRELLEDKYVLWERASREGPMDLRDYNRRASAALKAALCIVVEGPVRTTAWLVEWPATKYDPNRYWHASSPAVMDPHDATWLVRKEDAEAVIVRDGLRAGARPVEHVFGLVVSALPDTLSGAKSKENTSALDKTTDARCSTTATETTAITGKEDQ